MRPSQSPKRLVLTLAAALVLLVPSTAQAVFDFTVAPRRGGQDLRIRFDEAIQEQQGSGMLRNEEVRLTVTTTENVPYRITETVNQAPTDVRTGRTLPLNSFFQFSPSSPIGRLDAKLETPVTPGVKQIYTNTTGESDEFFLIFNVRLGEDQPGGVYRTQITFTAEALNPGTSFSPRVVTMNIEIEIPQTFRMTARSARGGRDLDLGRIRKEAAAASSTYRLDVDSNVGAEYRIIQQLADPLSSADGEIIDPAVFTWSLVGGAGEGSGGPRPVSTSPEMIYRSDPQGNGAALQIQYAATPREGQKAGVYRGTITFRVESNSPLVRQETVTVPVQLEVEPILYLDIETRTGGGISFGRFRADAEAKETQVVVTVHTNLGKEYTVSQILPHALATRGGHSIPADALQYYGAEAQSGRLTTQVPTPVKEGETIVYRSDSKGKAEAFSLNYRLAVPKDTPAGAYNSELKYSITTL